MYAERPTEAAQEAKRIQDALDAYASDKREWSRQSSVRSQRVQSFLNRLDGGE